MRGTSERLSRGLVSSLLLDSEIQIRLLLARSRLLDPFRSSLPHEQYPVFYLERCTKAAPQPTMSLHKRVSRSNIHHELVCSLLPLCFVVDEG